MGRIDDPDYANKAIRRLRTYEHNGIILGDNLIVTMETSKVPINMEVIDKIIDSLR